MVIDSAKLEGEVFPSFKNIFVLLTSNDFLGLMIRTTFSTWVFTSTDLRFLKESLSFHR